MIDFVSRFAAVTDRYLPELNAVAKLSTAARLLAAFHYHRDRAAAQDTSFHGIPPVNCDSAGIAQEPGANISLLHVTLVWNLREVTLTDGDRHEHPRGGGGQLGRG